MASEQQDGGPCVNTDRHLWPETSDPHAERESIHVTAQGGIGINVGGYVYVKPLREWHKLAGGKEAMQPVRDKASKEQVEETELQRVYKLVDYWHAESERWRAQAFRPLGDNHHNAKLCPHCSPAETTAPLAYSDACALLAMYAIALEVWFTRKDDASAAELQKARKACTNAMGASAPETPIDHTLVLRVCTAYEQGFGQYGRALENPYAPATKESEAWNMGWQVAKQRAEPKAGDEVVLHIPLSEGFGGVRPPNDGWKISRIDRPVYVFLKHSNGSEISLSPGQFSVKTSAGEMPPHAGYGCGPDTPWDLLCHEPSCAYCGARRIEKQEPLT